MKITSLIEGAVIVCLSCFAFPVFAADGFGRYTTGGAGGTTVTVTTAADLASYVGIIDTPYIIQVSGTIDLNSLIDDGNKVSIRSNKTIKGIGENPTIIGSLAFKKGSSNVIIERLNISSPSGYGEGDGISVKEDINNVFITKCTFYDCWDGCLDITRRSDWVTVSWCKFYFTYRNTNHNRVTLVGAGDGHTTDLGKLHVTFHHNWYGDMCMQRIPSVRFGRAHIYNNYYNCPGNLYCIWSRIQAECLIENNYFKDVANPYYNIDYPTGKIGASGNVFVNCTGTIHPGTDTVFTPSYSYTLDDANDVPILAQYGAGADGIDFFPHWLFGPYGDFDRNGIVDMNDLLQFVEYWLKTDDIADADYYADGIVDFREFALFAQNWSGN
jgi:pectate lyase